MKKILVLTVIAVAAISASCRKERTCDCKITETRVRTGFNASTREDITSLKVTLDKQKKKEFKTATNCFSTKGTRTQYGGSGPTAYTTVITDETTCDLK